MKTQIISLNTLQAFCEPKGTLRDYISVPALIDGRVLATDGHLIIIAPESECETTAFDRKGLTNFPNLDHIEEDDYSQTFNVTLPDYETEECPNCDGAGMFVDVESLQDAVQVIQTCHHCEGTGSAFKKSTTHLGGLDVDSINSRLLDKARKALGNEVIIGISKNDNKPFKITAQDQQIKTVIYLMGMRATLETEVGTDHIVCLSPTSINTNEYYTIT